MTKVIEKSLAKKGLKQTRSVRTKQVKMADGAVLKLHTISADSRTFSDDLTFVFKKNVARAIRASKAIAVSSGRRSAKG